MLPCRWGWGKGAKLFSAPKFTLALLLAEAVEEFVQFLLQLLEQLAPFFFESLVEDLTGLFAEPRYDFVLNNT